MPGTRGQVKSLSSQVPGIKVTPSPPKVEHLSALVLPPALPPPRATSVSPAPERAYTASLPWPCRLEPTAARRGELGTQAQDSRVKSEENLGEHQTSSPPPNLLSDLDQPRLSHPRSKAV